MLCGCRKGFSSRTNWKLVRRRSYSLNIFYAQQNNVWWSALQRRNEYSCYQLYRHDMFNKISFVWQHHDQGLNGCDRLLLFLFVVVACLLFPKKVLHSALIDLRMLWRLLMLHFYRNLTSAPFPCMFTWDRPLHEMRYFTLHSTTKCG